MYGLQLSIGEDMMKVSTKGIYAMEALIDLATNSRDGVENIKNIAERRQLSEKYLEQIIGALRRAGIIQSVRGAGGGYRLSYPVDKITALQILEAVENSLVPVDCLYKQTDCGIDCEICATRVFWNRVWDLISNTLENVSLEDLMKERDSYECSEIEYYI